VSGDRSLPEDPGWYPDPYDRDRQRWFDGTKWTLHAVADWEADPDRVVDRNWHADSPEQLRRQEWEAQFPAKGTISFQTALPRFDRKSGLFVNRPHPWAETFLSLFTLIVFGVIAIATAVKAGTGPQYWGIWAALSALSLGLTIVTAIRTIRGWPHLHRINRGFDASSGKGRRSDRSSKG
jgi:hypothetical protein